MLRYAFMACRFSACTSLAGASSSAPWAPPAALNQAVGLSEQSPNPSIFSIIVCWRFCMQLLPLGMLEPFSKLGSSVSASKW